MIDTTLTPSRIPYPISVEQQSKGQWLAKEDSWMKHAGMFKDEPLFDEVLEEIAIYRRELDADRPELRSDNI